ncbi:MAG TPA: tripartite tricarboxylate transporter substrate binding protein [Sinorhizobium sp.]|nr:tripartite tricarboxylate transporter substrate binding protein [Sinorhizobium sp.]
MVFPTRFLVVGATTLACAVSTAFAQGDYPNRAVRVVVPSSPGGGTDTLTRRITPAFEKRLGQNVVVDNRPGAGSIIGNEIVAHSKPDGYTLLMGISTLAILPATRKKLPYDALKDLAPITQTVAAPNILVVHPSLPVTTVKQLIAFAKKHPGELNYASAGPGTNPHLVMELFLNMTDTKMVHIPYKGLGPALVDLMTGRVVVASGTMLSSLRYVQDGRLRGLATTGLKRSSALPDLPTVDEAGVKGFDATQWYGLFAPAGTPKPIIDKINRAMVDALRAESAKFAKDGADAVGNSPEEFARIMQSETVKWGKIVKMAGITPR